MTVLGNQSLVFILIRGSVEELKCCLCGKHLGWVSVFDMNENYEICDECVPGQVEKLKA